MPRQVRRPVQKRGSNRTPLIVLAVVLVAMAASALAIFQPWNTRPQVPAWLVFENPQDFNRELTETIVKIAVDWKARYGCENTVTIRRRPAVVTSSDIIPETAQRGLIEIDPSWSYFEYSWTDPMTHSMFHACVKEGTRKPSRPFEITANLPPGINRLWVDEFNGGAIVWARDDGLFNPRPEIEEGAAEFLAVQFSTYHPSDGERYMKGLKLFRSSGLNPDQVWEYLRDSDMEGLVAAYYHIDAADLTAQDFENIQREFFEP